jgi:murein DD-endopeptidase MepM/ murein hydrolase activator NlpD
MRSLPAVLLLLLTLSGTASAQLASDSTKRPIEQVMLNPVFGEAYSCSEHAAGELPYLGDDLGQDCVIQSFVTANGGMFMRSYKNDGQANEDWYGWDRPVLAPCDCRVTRISINSVTNQPGHTGRPPASVIELELVGGTHVILAHIQNPSVKTGDAVKAGQQIAKVGNNGFARIPHIHIGAWRGKDALQIRWDQKAIPIE